jgi:hypothetical protein
LLKRTRVEVAPATFVLVGMRHEDWSRLLEQPELSPRASVPFMLLRDSREVTLLLEEEDWLVMRHAVREARVETGWRLVTLDIKLDWNVTGFLARVTITCSLNKTISDTPCACSASTSRNFAEAADFK